MWLGTTLEFVIPRDRVGLSLTISIITFCHIHRFHNYFHIHCQPLFNPETDTTDECNMRWWWWWWCCQQRSHWHVVQFHSVWHNFNSTAAGAPVSAWSYLTNISTSLVHLSPTYLSSSRSHISVLHPLFVASWRYIQLKLWDVFHYFRSRLITHWRSSFNDQQNTWFLPQTHF